MKGVRVAKHFTSDWALRQSKLNQVSAVADGPARRNHAAVYDHCDKLAVDRRGCCQLRPNSHRPPDTTRQSYLCRVWRGGVNGTIAINVYRLKFFCRRQS